jgi:tRNA modification GTPase
MLRGYITRRACVARLQPSLAGFWLSKPQQRTRLVRPQVSKRPEIGAVGLRGFHHAASDTIYALSTAPGRAAIAVIRISGPACLDIYRRLCPGRPSPKPRNATLRRIYEPADHNGPEEKVLDARALLLHFPAPKTVTGEDVLELHVHGGPAIVRSVLGAIARCGSFSHDGTGVIRHAEPGEFTKRAFYNGRIDLTQAEALGESLAAETEQQRLLAVSGTDSGLAQRYEQWRTMLLHARGELEALIDFSEDQHFDDSPAEFMASVANQVQKLRRQIQLHIRNASKGELLRKGISIALLGAPNAGKSSLLNRVVGREAAIVSNEEGTTRDIVDVAVDIGGWLCRFGDMAGLRLSEKRRVGAIEQEGIRRAKERALQSDVVVVLLSIEVDADGSPQLSVNDEVFQAVQGCLAAKKSILVAINKADLVADGTRLRDLTTLGIKLHTRARELLSLVPEDRVCTISCIQAASSDNVNGSDPDPGNIQAFLSVLTNAFTELTAASSTADDTESARLTPPEAQSYWTVSLSVTHRQSTHLQQCLLRLEDFLALAATSHAYTPAQSHLHNVDQRSQSPRFSASSSLDSDYHVDRHDDLVGPNIVPETVGTLGADDSVDIVTAAEHLRVAADCLAKITGKGESGDVEDVLGVVFEK